jgi:hypothetical protein
VKKLTQQQYETLLNLVIIIESDVTQIDGISLEAPERSLEGIQRNCDEIIALITLIRN